MGTGVWKHYIKYLHYSNAVNSDAAFEGFIFKCGCCFEAFLPNSTIGTKHVSMSSVSPATTG